MNRIMKKTLIFFLLINELFAQQPTVNPNNNNDDDMKKYWFYRTKLVNDFMLVGTGQGMSLPFNRRGKDAHSSGFHSATLEVGDEISTLGYYIGVLATEYKLLIDNGQDITKVNHELFCALNAVNRLDYNAENALYGSCPNNLNGFLMRDDIPTYFVRDNYDHFNYFNHGTYIDNITGHPFPNEFPINSGNFGTADRGFASIAQQGQYTVESNYSDYVDVKHYADKSDVYMSQDHAINLLFGLSLVRALVDGSATDGNNDFTAYEPSYLNVNHKLLVEAENIAGRLVHYVGKTCSWHIKDPCTGIGLNIYQGGYAEPFSYPLAEIGCIATGQGVSTAACTGCPAPTACGTYHDWYTESLGFLSWQALSNTAATKNDNASMIAQLDASCNCIYSTVASHFINQTTQVLTKIWSWLGWLWGWVTSIITTIVSYFFPILNTNDTNDGMEANVEYWDYQYAPFARRLIHGGNALLVRPENVFFHGKPGYQYMNDLIDLAPCEGPWNAGWPAYSQDEWSSSSRIDHPEQRTDGVYNGIANNIVTGEYNGIDYMLYHNIWRLYHNRYMSGNFKMIDLSDRIIKDNFPLSSGLGSMATPIEIDAFETVEMLGNVGNSAPANVTVRAGKWIHYPAGWHANSNNGTIYHAVPSTPFGCTPNSYVNNNFHSRTQDSSIANTKSPNGYNYASTNMGIVKTHHVEYSPEVVNYSPNTPVEVDNTVPIKNQLNQATPNYQQAMVNAVVKSAMEENDLLILPNPSNGIFKIKLPAAYKSNTMNIWIYDISGNLIANKENLKKWPEAEDINISEYGAGTYMLRILTENGKSYTRRVIVK